MLIEKINNEKIINHSQKVLLQLQNSIANEKKYIQLVVSPLISQLVLLDGLLEQSRKRIEKNSYSTTSEEYKAYIAMLKEYSDITQQLINILQK